MPTGVFDVLLLFGVIPLAIKMSSNASRSSVSTSTSVCAIASSALRCSLMTPSACLSAPVNYFLHFLIYLRSNLAIARPIHPRQKIARCAEAAKAIGHFSDMP